AMTSGRKPRDQSPIDCILSRRTASLSAQNSGKDAFRALEAMIADFDGLKDTSDLAVRAAALGRDKRVRDALKKERGEEDQEQRQISEIMALENQLSSADQRQSALAQLRDRWKRLAAVANVSADSSGRRIARRVQRGLAMGAAERTKDPEYGRLIEEFRPPRAITQ